MKRIKLHHYGHRALFCCMACKDGFVEDRRNGAIYGPYWLQEHGRFAVSAEEMSVLEKTCPYCGVKEGQPCE